MPEHHLAEGRRGGAHRSARTDHSRCATAYAERARLAVATADAVGLRAYEPQGTIYMLLDVGEHGADGGLEFALELLRDAHVSIAPGSVFGPGGHGMVRISLAAAETTIEQGIRRIAEHVADARQRPTPRPGKQVTVLFDGIDRRLTTDAQRHVAAFVAERADEIFDFTCELIRTPSVNPPGDEVPVSRVITDRLHALGIDDCSIAAADPARPNVMAHVAGTAAGPHADAVGPHRHEAGREPGRVAHRPVGRPRSIDDQLHRSRLGRHEGARSPR